MNLPNEIWYNVFSFLTQQSQSKFSSLLNLYNLSAEEIELMYNSNNLWVDTSCNGYVNLMKFLIKAGVNINIQNNHGWTALHLASRFGKKEIVELLIKVAGVNVNIQDNDGKTALHEASRYGYKDCVELLIKVGGVNVNIQNNDGSTALHYACYHGYKEIVELLIKSGANGEYFKKK